MIDHHLSIGTLDEKLRQWRGERKMKDRDIIRLRFCEGTHEIRLPFKRRIPCQTIDVGLITLRPKKLP